FGERGQLMANMEEALEFNKQGASSAGQTSLFGLLEDKSGLPDLKLKPAEPASLTEKLAWEKELLGLYVSGHPLDKHKEKFEKNEHTITKIKEYPNGKGIIIAGLVEEVRMVITKKNDQMAFVKISDLTDSIECVVFPTPYGQFKLLLAPEKCVAIRGTVSLRNGSPSIIIEAVKALE
ncbi:MAG: OB-fold nucleic acid binding domain-containing protein, partial [Patescibacteria group bacterium]